MATLLRSRRVGCIASVTVALSVTIAASQGPKHSGPDKKPARATLAELWAAPSAGRDLFYGVGGRRLQPDPRQLFTVVEIKANGFSDGYIVKDESKREWSAKLPPEGPTEVVASRILWGIGYHQPPLYLLEAWRASGATEPNPQQPARFREKKPKFHGLDDKGDWSYYDNPFLNSRPLNGLLVLQAMLGNSDLKDQQNALYELDAPIEGARRWFVSRDLGQTFGRTGRFDPPRGDIDAFERTPFIRGVDGDHVTLEYHGRHEVLFEHLTVADVRWICQQLDRLTDRQWHDAFRAGGYELPLAERFIRRFKAKIAEGLSLRASKGRPS
jgi:hypothetical protein